MPAPPQKGESQKSFLKRCISHMVSKEGRKQEQGVAICYSMWRKRNKVNQKARQGKKVR